VETMAEGLAPCATCGEFQGSERWQTSTKLPPEWPSCLSLQDPFAASEVIAQNTPQCLSVSVRLRCFGTHFRVCSTIFKNRAIHHVLFCKMTETTETPRQRQICRPGF
jgi:hypothetical protein